jgi:arginine/lysine/ornithine decarboxylase
MSGLHDFPRLTHQLFPVDLAEAWLEFSLKAERVPLRESVGRISLEFVVPYPPGSPVIIPGQRISEEVVEYILRILELGGEVIMSDGLGLTIKVLRDG